MSLANIDLVPWRHLIDLGSSQDAEQIADDIVLEPVDD
jgi:hypothetical protein